MALRGVQILDAGRTIPDRSQTRHCAALTDLGLMYPIPRARFIRYWDPSDRDPSTSLDDARSIGRHPSPPVHSRSCRTSRLTA